MKLSIPIGYGLWHWGFVFATIDSMAHISCNMRTRGLPDMYTLGPRPSGVHIRQTIHAHVTTITCMYVVIIFVLAMH